MQHTTTVPSRLPHLVYTYVALYIDALRNSSCTHYECMHMHRTRKQLIFLQSAQLKLYARLVHVGTTVYCTSTVFTIYSSCRKCKYSKRPRTLYMYK